MKPTTLKRLLNRPTDSNKYDFGHVLVIGGSPGMIGAPLLAARAALRTGAGVVTIASSPEVIDKLEKRVTEIMTLRLPDDGTAALRVLGNFIKSRHVSVLAIGPGVPEQMSSLVKAIVKKVDLPIVLDAGGIAAYKRNLSALGRVVRENRSIVITPHRGELAQLIGKNLPVPVGQLRNLVLATAKTSGLVIALKGHRSFVAEPSGFSYTDQTGNPGLATAGSGDVLTGVITALMAQGLNGFDAAVSGVHIHGLAGDLAADKKTQLGMIASDVIEALPAAFRRM